MDQKFQLYLEHHSRWNRFSIYLTAWAFAFVIPNWVANYFLDLEACVLNDPEFIEILAPKDVSYNEWIITSCVRDHQHHFVSYFWIAMVLMFAALQTFKPDAMGLTPKKSEGSAFSKKTAALSVIIEWFPTIIGAVYILTSSAVVSISSTWTLYLATGLSQLIWIAPVWFRINGKNIADTITGIEYEITTKDQEKLEAKFERKPKHKGVGSTFYALLLIFCTFGTIQALRVPEQNPAYQQALYEGTEPIWKDNTYFAMQGLSAPEEVEDFYRYGEVFAHQKFRAFQAMKRKSGTRAEYLFDVPDMEYGSIDTDLEKGIKLNETGWKKLRCIYDVREHKNDQCASLSDIPKYIDMNKVLWERYNKIPDVGSVYKAPPQLLGAKLDNYPELTDLKAAHIIYLAENEQPHEAMSEWLRFMTLFRAMAEDRSSTIMKAMMAVQIKKFIKALESLLYISPDLANEFKEEILGVLLVDGNIFNEQYMMATDWGQIEPFSIGTIGHQSALQNELLVCIETLRDLGLKSVEDFPYASEDVKLCPMDASNLATYKYLIKSALTPGNFRANFINVVLFPGLLKGEKLMEEMKVLQVQFLQAELAVKVLSESIAAGEVARYISKLGPEYHNPIEGAAFEWEEQRQALAFHRPDGKRLSYFRLNLKNQ